LSDRRVRAYQSDPRLREQATAQSASSAAAPEQRFPRALSREGVERLPTLRSPNEFVAQKKQCC
jgi:hypothetical protein